MESFITNFYLLYGFFTLIIILDLVGGYFNRKMLYLKFQDFFIFLFLGWYYILLSTRSLDVGADTERYFRFYQSMNTYGESIVGSDLGFSIFNKLLVTLGVDSSIYLFFVSLLFVVPIYFAFTKFENINKVFLLWFFASLFIFLTMSINVLRQGIGGVFVLWGISLYLNRKDKSKIFLVPLIIAPFFHLSLVIVSAIFFITRYFKSEKIAYVILLTSILLSYIGFDLNKVLGNLPIIDVLSQDRMVGYLGENSKSYKVGFRFDFLAFNVFFVALGRYISRLKFVQQHYPIYNQIYIAYILLTSCFVLMFNIPFSDRFGILSWILIPFLIYPICQLSSFKSNSLKFGLVVLAISLFVIFNVVGQ